MKMLKNFSTYFKKKTGTRCLHPTSPTLLLIYLDTFSYYFITTFPLKVTCVKDCIVNKWITKGINTLRNKLLLLYNIKRSMNLPMESLNYIQSYQSIFRKVIKETKRREVDRLILSAKNKN